MRTVYLVIPEAARARGQSFRVGFEPVVKLMVELGQISERNGIVVLSVEQVDWHVTEVVLEGDADYIALKMHFGHMMTDVKPPPSNWSTPTIVSGTKPSTGLVEPCKSSTKQVISLRERKSLSAMGATLAALWARVSPKR